MDLNRENSSISSLGWENHFDELFKLHKANLMEFFKQNKQKNEKYKKAYYTFNLFQILIGICVTTISLISDNNNHAYIANVIFGAMISLSSSVQNLFKIQEKLDITTKNMTRSLNQVNEIDFVLSIPESKRTIDQFSHVHNNLVFIDGQ